jgi:hypothetical protein
MVSSTVPRLAAGGADRPDDQLADFLRQRNALLRRQFFDVRRRIYLVEYSIHSMISTI